MEKSQDQMETNEMRVKQLDDRPTRSIQHLNEHLMKYLFVEPLKKAH